MIVLPACVGLSTLQEVQAAVLALAADLRVESVHVELGVGVVLGVAHTDEPPTCGATDWLLIPGLAKSLERALEQGELQLA